MAKKKRLLNRLISLKGNTKKEETKNIASKTVYCYLDSQLVADYESISKCAAALGMSRAMVKKAIDNAVELENGFLLTLNKL